MTEKLKWRQLSALCVPQLLCSDQTQTAAELTVFTVWFIYLKGRAMEWQMYVQRPKYLSHLPLPPWVHQQGIGLDTEQPGLKPVLLCDVGVIGNGLTHCATILTSRAELLVKEWNIHDIWILEHFLQELTQEIRHSFPHTVFKMKQNQNKVYPRGGSGPFEVKSGQVKSQGRSWCQCSRTWRDR